MKMENKCNHRPCQKIFPSCSLSKGGWLPYFFSPAKLFVSTMECYVVRHDLHILCTKIYIKNLIDSGKYLHHCSYIHRSAAFSFLFSCNANIYSFYLSSSSKICPLSNYFHRHSLIM